MSDSDDEGGKVIDIRDRLPPVAFGESPTGVVAAKLFTVLINDNSRPAEHLAALMVTSIALQQNILKEGWGLDEEAMRRIREEAMVIADGMRITVELKAGMPPKEDPPKGA